MSNVTQYIDKSFIPPMVWNILLLIVIAGGVWVVWGLLKKTKHLVKAVITAVLLGVLMGGIHFNNWMDYKHLDSASVVVDGQSPRLGVFSRLKFPVRKPRLRIGVRPIQSIIRMLLTPLRIIVILPRSKGLV